MSKIEVEIIETDNDNFTKSDGGKNLNRMKN